jgi:pyruvate,water dikinase
VDVAGGKGASLARLAIAGLSVPTGYHVITEAYRRFVAANDLQARIADAIARVDVSRPETLAAASQAITYLFMEATIPSEIADAVTQAYAALPGHSPAVAVRSSATAEDLPTASFAGQQETYLNVSGPAAVLEATRKCWASLWTARAIDYRTRLDIPVADVALAVVVQVLVPAEASGILFTANPVNSRRDQMVINASWGLGEAIVGGAVTPDTLTLDKASGNVIARETAEKNIQTVRVNGGVQEQPVPANLRRTPVLDAKQAAELVHLGNQIEALYGMPMDIEWALANGEFAIVQARPITALPEVQPEPPTNWKLPKGAYAAMRNNIVEMMIEPLTPLFSTLGLNAVNTSLGGLLAQFFGRPGMMPEPLIITVNHYAYYNGSIKFVPMLRMMLGAPGIMKRMFTGAVERWTEEGRPRYIATVEHWHSQRWLTLPAVEMLNAVRELAEAAIDAYGALVGGVIPAAWISEALFTKIYKLLKRRSDPNAPTYLLGFDSLPIQGEKALYDLAQWTQEQTGLATYLQETPTSHLVIQIEAGRTPPDVNVDAWDTWRRRFRAYLQDYGHQIYNLDFGTPIPADDPAPVLETFKLFLSGQGDDPRERQQESARRRETATATMLNRLKGMRRRIFQKSLARAQRYAPLREDGLAAVGLSYPLLRQMLFELGRRFVTAGMIVKAEDVVWLTEDEVADAAARLDQGQTLENLSTLIPQRQVEWRVAHQVTAPMMLPQMKVFGFDLMQLKTGRRKGMKGNALKGVAASPGSVTAPACVVHGPEDFAQMKTGDVLVAALTTPAWTPLFARAAAVVTDIGGPLSHGSIVAREYGIPAVLGTGSATRDIRSGQVITVNGSAGMVTFS